MLARTETVLVPTVSRLSARHPESPAPMSTALLVIDMQQALCSGEEAVHGIEGVIARVNDLVRRARAASAPVLLVQHEEAEGPLAHGAPGWQLVEGLKAVDTDPRFRKTTPNAFHNTPLQPWLQAHGITRLVVCGLQTDFCVDTTVRQALPLGYAVALAADAHSTTDGVISAAQVIAHHNRTLRHMTHFGPDMQVLPAADIAYTA